MKFLVVMPSGGSIRGFLCTRFIDHLLEEGEVAIWHTLPDSSIERFRRQWGERVRWTRIPAFGETLSERVLRQARAYAHIYWKYTRNRENLLERVRPSGPWWNRLLGRFSGALGWWCAGDERIVWLDQWYERAAGGAPHMREFKRRLAEESPDVVFCTYQRAIRAIPPMVAARQLAIPTATFIYSWDNLPKGRIAVPSDYYFVWSDSMREELLEYHRNVERDRVLAVGTPQFEHYGCEELIEPRKVFLGRLGLSADRPVVCFSGDDVKTSPHDPFYLADLAEAMRSVPAAARPQVLFRPCPTDKSNRFDAVLARYPEIVRSEPLWSAPEGSDWSQVIPSKEDITLLLNVVRHSDVVVNVGSTMAMDFAVFDKPAVYVAYNPPVNGSPWSIEDIYALPHFASVHRFQPVYWARSPGEVGDQVMRALQCPRELSEARCAWLRHHVRQPMEEATARFAEALIRLGRGVNDTNYATV